jgi:hypothetical protein
MKKNQELRKIIYSEEWRHCVVVYIGTKEGLIKWLDWNDRWPDSKQIKEQVEDSLSSYAIGTMYPCKTASSLVWIPKWPKTPQVIASLSHEILHATFHMLDVLGVEYRYEGTNETYTYTFEYFFKKALNPRGYKEIKDIMNEENN